MVFIDVPQLVSEMSTAAEQVFAERWPEVKAYAEPELAKIGELIAMICAQHALGQIRAEKARMHLEMQKNTARCALFTIEGLSVLTVEAALNSALDAVKDTVNESVAFGLV